MAHSLLFRRLVLALQVARREQRQAKDLPEPIPQTQQGWSRRRFMKTSAVAGMAGMVGQSLPLSSWAGFKHAEQRVAIVGAGIAGLNAGYQLKKAGVNATLYEAGSRVGGRMLSTTIDNGLAIDLGAELVNTDHADMLGLVDELGIELFNKLQDAAQWPVPKERFFFDGISIGEAQLAEDLAAIAAQISADAGLLDQDWDRYAPLFDQLSVGDYLDQHADKLAAPYIRTLLENALRTEFGAEAGESSCLQLLFILPQVNGNAVDLLSYSDETYAVVGGSAQITNAIANNLDGQIQLGKALTAVKRQGGEYRLSFADGSTAPADIVIITAPFPALRKVKLELALPGLFRRFIAEAGLGANEKLIAGFSERFWHGPQGFSLAAWTDFGFSEVWDETQRQPQRSDGALNFFLGGDQARGLSNRSYKPLASKFIAEIDEFIPGAVAAANGTLAKSAWSDNRYVGGGYASFKPGQLTTFSEYFWVEGDLASAQQVAFDRLIFAGEHLSDAYYGFMEGGAQTGRLAAAMALNMMAVRG